MKPRLLLARAGCLGSLALTFACATPAPLVPGMARAELPKARRAELVLNCVPPDAEVALDGVPQGTCADFDGVRRALSLGAVARRVDVKKAGFSTWSSWMQADHTRVAMDVTLIPNGGSSP